MVDISGLSKAKVLAVLYNGSRPQGLGFMSYSSESMTEKEAQAILDSGQTDFDYLNGRAVKISLENDDELDPYNYDCDNGDGAAQKIIDELKTSDNINSPTAQDIHKSGKVAAAEEVFEHIDERDELHLRRGPISKYKLGLSEYADDLRPAVHKALEE